MKTTNVEVIDVSLNISNLKLKLGVQIIELKTIGNIYEPKIVLEDKVYLKMYYNHQLRSVVVDETPTKIKAQKLLIVGWTLTKDQQLMKLNLGIDAKPQLVKINAQLDIGKVLEAKQLLKEFKDVFAWTYKNLHGIPPELAQHKIKLNTTIPSAHQARYRFNPNYVTIIKQDIDKLLASRFIKSIEEATWLSPIVIIPKKNGETENLYRFQKIKCSHKEGSIPITFYK